MKLKNVIFSYSALFILSVSIKMFILRWLIFNEPDFLTIISAEIWFILPAFLLGSLVLQKIKWLNYILFSLLTSLLFIAILIYHRYFLTLPTYYDFFQMDQAGTVSESIWLLVNPAYLFFFIDIVIVPFLLKYLGSKEAAFSRYMPAIPVLLLSLLAAVLHVQANTDVKLYDANNVAKEKGIFTYEALQYVTSSGMAATASLPDISEQEAIMELKGTEPSSGAKRFFGAAKEENLIVVQIESLQDMVINMKVDGKEITPNLNKLVNESFYFTNLFQQIGAGNTSDAEFLMNTSLYPAGLKPSSKAYVDKALPSLPKKLKEHGYYSATFHGDAVTYWNRIQLYPALGFDKYYDIKYFGKKDMIGMGPSDEWFYKKTAEALKEINKDHQPFYAFVLSLTSHVPFELPEEKIKLELSSKYDDTLFGNYLTSIHYADYALGLFIEDLKEKGLWDNTVFAVYGDHSGFHLKVGTEKDKKLAQEVLGHPYGLADRFNLPFMIRVPGKEGGLFSNTAGQIDMMPTIANLLGVSFDNHLLFGQDLLNSKNNLIGMRYYAPAGTYINDDILFYNTQDKGIVYDLKTKRRLEITEEDNQYEDDKERILTILEASDTYVNELPSRK